MPRVLTLGSLAAAALGGAAGLAPLPSAAADYDIDCAVIRCMAVGFPSKPSGTCSDAHNYMIDRITDRPPEPPFDTCTMSDGSVYNAAEVAFARPPRQSHAGWICSEPAPMGFDETADYTFATPSCFPDAEFSLALTPEELGRDRGAADDQAGRGSVNRWVPALGFALVAASSASAQEACLRPVPPEEVRPPTDDREFRDFLNQEYQAYLLAMQEYLNCLGREHESATKEANEIMARWMLWFGDDARIHSGNRGPARP